MIKPDGVQRGLAGKIIQRFEERGYKLVSATSPQSALRPRARGPSRAAAAGPGMGAAASSHADADAARRVPRPRSR